MFHKNLVYATTQSEYQKVMHWRLILEEFGTNIQRIAGGDNNIVADRLSRFSYTNFNRYDTCNNRVLSQVNESFTTTV